MVNKYNFNLNLAYIYVCKSKQINLIYTSIVELTETLVVDSEFKIITFLLNYTGMVADTEVVLEAHGHSENNIERKL